MGEAKNCEYNISSTGYKVRWPTNSTGTVHSTVNCRSLVSPDNAGNNTHAAQKALHQTSEFSEDVDI